jgi:hypothetical protein
MQKQRPLKNKPEKMLSHYPNVALKTYRICYCQANYLLGSPEQLMQQIARTGVTQTDGDPRVSNGIAMSKAALANQSATMEQIIAQIDGATSLTDKQKQRLSKV